VEEAQLPRWNLRLQVVQDDFRRSGLRLEMLIPGELNEFAFIDAIEAHILYVEWFVKERIWLKQQAEAKGGDEHPLLDGPRPYVRDGLLKRCVEAARRDAAL
jgi:hypothetical protein